MSFQPIEVPAVDQTAAPGFTPIERDAPTITDTAQPKRRPAPADTTAKVEKQEN